MTGRGCEVVPAQVSAPERLGLTALAMALRAGDPVAAAAAFTEDGALSVHPAGTTATGRDAIEAVLRRLLATATDTDARPDDAGRHTVRLRCALPDGAVETVARLAVEPDGALIRSLTVHLDADDPRVRRAFETLFPAGSDVWSAEPGTKVHRQIIPLQQRLFAASQEAGALERARLRRLRRIRTAIVASVSTALLLGVTVMGVVAYVNRPPAPKPAGRPEPVAAAPAQSGAPAAPAASASAGAPPPDAAQPSATQASPAQPSPTAPPTIVRLSSTLLFAGDSAVLRSDAQATIAAVGREIRLRRPREVTVTGYAAAGGGGTQDPQQLSQDRAKAVADVLRGALAGTPITVVDHGLGTANPVAPNDSEANRAKNRRVEISYEATA